MTALMIGWFAVTLVGVAWLAYDIYTHTPAMKLMKPGWILTAMYTGPVGVAAYLLTCRQPAATGDPGGRSRYDMHDAFIRPLWRQAMGSLVHCLAGDATGVIFAATFASLLGVAGMADAALEYAMGFIFGLFIFQALFMRSMFGGYWPAVRKTVYVEWVSMNWVMAGMIPVVMLGKSLLPGAEHPASLGYWFVMQLGAIVGLLLGYPINYWLVGNGLKHGMMTDRPEEKHAEDQHQHMHEHEHNHAGGHSGHAMHAHMDHGHMDHAAAQPSLARRAVVAAISVAALAAGVGAGMALMPG